MAFRTWVIRGLILAVLGGIAAGLWQAQAYVSPESVRAALAATLADQFPGADVHVGSARMRVFGGISVRDLTLTRRGDAEPFFTAPTAVIYHDKEQINRGRLAIRKVELDGPRVRLECGPDGAWNVAGLAPPAAADRPVPTFVVTKATVAVTDRRPGGLPPLTITDAKLSLLNDPLPVIRVDGHAAVQVGAPGPAVSVRAAVSVRVNRATGQVQAGVELPDLPLGPELAGLVGAVKPAAAGYLGRLSGRAGLRADVAYHPGAPAPVRYDLRVAVADGRFTDPGLPAPAEQIAAVVHVRDGRVKVDHATARVGGATVEASLETRDVPQSPAAAAAGLSDFEDLLEHAAVTVRDLPLDDALFARLPTDAKAHDVRRLFGPAGTAHVGYRFARPPSGGWTRVVDLRPARLRLVYHKFRYPLDDVAGLVRHTVTGGGTDAIAVDLTGSAAGRRVEVKGTVAGAGPDPAIDLRVSGTGVPIDDRLFDALPNPKYRAALKKLRASGRADFVADIRQPAGVNRVENTFRITVADGALNHTSFPYPLDRVRGRIGVGVVSTDPTRPAPPARPGDDRIEFRDVEARYGPAAFTLSGDSGPAPGGTDRLLRLRVLGRDCPLDDRLRAALAAIRLDGVWRAFNPRGAMAFEVDVEIADRTGPPGGGRPAGPVAAAGGPVARLAARAREPAAPADPPFNPATDLKMALSFRGPTVTPDFFKYQLDGLAGRVRFDGDEVRVDRLTAAHGESKWSLAAGEVRLYDGGRVWANLGRLEVAPVVADRAFLDALPGNLKSGVEQLNLRGPAAVTIHHLVALTPPDGPPRAPELLPPPRLLPVARAQAGGSGKAHGRPSVGLDEDPDADIYWRGELRLAGAALDAGLDWDQVRGVIACTGRYLGTRLGDVAGAVWLDEATVANHPVSRVKAAFGARPQDPDPDHPGRYLPPAVMFTDMTGTLFRGSVDGEARVVLSEPPRYRLYVKAADVRLEDVARHHNLGNGAKLEGLAQGRLELRTAPDPATGEPVLTGGGSVDVTRGQMLNLPVLLPLLKTLKLQAPDKTAFEEGHASFTVRGDRIRVDHLDLLGTAVSLGGSGEVDTAGEYVKFEFYTIWSQTLQRWLTTPLGDVTAFVSEKLFKIEVTRGPDGKMKYDPRVVPFATAPFRAVADRVKRQAGPTARAAGK